MDFKLAREIVDEANKLNILSELMETIPDSLITMFDESSISCDSYNRCVALVALSNYDISTEYESNICALEDLLMTTLRAGI